MTGASHVFIIHSSITEVAALRIVEQLEYEAGPDFHDIVFICTRRYHHFSGKARSFDWFSLTGNNTSTYIHGKEAFSDFLISRRAAQKVVRSLQKHTFTLYTPHTRLLVSRSFIAHPSCREYSILEEGDLAYSHLLDGQLAARSEASSIPICSRAYRLAQTAYSNLPALASRAISEAYFYATNLPHIPQYIAYELDFRSWYIAKPEKVGTFYGITNEAFSRLTCYKRNYLLSPCREEIQCLARLRTSYPKASGSCLVLIPLPYTGHKLQISQKKSIPGVSPEMARIFRTHPEDHRSIQEACASHGINSSEISTLSELLRHEPLELLVASLDLTIANPEISSARRYLEMYN